MPWSPLTSADVLACLVSTQIQALRGSLAPGQADPLPVLIADVTARVRAEIRGNLRNRVERNPALLPPELKLTAAHLALESLQARLPNLALTADQVRLANEARQFLARIARGEVPIATPPDEPESHLETSSPFGVEVVHHRRRNVSGENLSSF